MAGRKEWGSEVWMRRKVEEKKKVAESHSTKEWKKIIKENERLVGCKKLASLFFRPKSAPLIALGIKSHSTKAAKEVWMDEKKEN